MENPVLAIVELSVYPSVTRWYCVKATQAMITFSLSDTSRILFLDVKVSSRNWRWFIAIEGLRVGRKIGVFRPISRHISETVHGQRLLLTTNRKSHALSISPTSKINDFEWLWTDITHSSSKYMSLSDTTMKSWIKRDPYYQQQNVF